MFDLKHLDCLIAFEHLQRAGYPLEAEDALVAWNRGDIYRPSRYMELPEDIRQAIALVNWQTLAEHPNDAHPGR